jgi:hypothetical protein
MLYVPDTNSATSYIPTPITGRSLAHGKRSVTECALVGADLCLGYVALTSPTVKQCAALAGVCIPYVTAAIRVTLADDPAVREAVTAGRRSLLEAAKAAANTETLAEHFARCAPNEWREAARVIGVNVVWDKMIEPLIGSSAVAP